MKLVVSPRARQDISDIEDFTARRWGDRQAVLYLADIAAACARVAARPNVGRERAGSGVYRTYRVGSHLLIYGYSDPDGIEIVRILHQSMDIAARLAAER